MRSIHRLVAVLVTLCIVPLALVACDRGGKGSEFKVALITPGPVTDDGWNSYAFEGLKRIETELSAKVRHFQTKSPSEFESTLQNFANDGYSLVIAHGHEYSDAVKKVAAQFPTTAFVVTSGSVVGKNVSSIDFAIEDPSYLAGMLAGSVSKSGRIGCVGGMEIDPVKDAFESFKRGALEVRSDATVVVSWVGSWDDVAAANQATRSLIGKGADFFFHDADAAGLGVFNAAEEAGLLAIGCNKNQNSVKPKTVVASVVLEIPAAFVGVAREVKEARFEGTMRKLTMKDGFVHLVQNPSLASAVPEVARRRIESKTAELVR